MPPAPPAPPLGPPPAPPVVPLPSLPVLARQRTATASASGGIVVAGWVRAAVSAESAAASRKAVDTAFKVSASANGRVVHDLNIPQGDAGAHMTVEIATDEHGAAGAHAAAAAAVPSLAAVTALSKRVGERDVADGNVAGVGEENALAAPAVDRVVPATDDELAAGLRVEDRQRSRQVDTGRKRDGVDRVRAGIGAVDRGDQLMLAIDGRKPRRAPRWRRRAARLRARPRAS